MGLTNVILMLPFVRRVAEADQVLQTIADHGLRRGENGLKVYAMCEIPKNVILIDEFAKHFDGYSIGSNDLAPLTLGVDRDSEIVAFDYDERDDGVKRLSAWPSRAAAATASTLESAVKCPRTTPTWSSS